ncbi:Amidase 1 [Melia azedarach]|uniref:Amidase 1 n=1 Tax=Melia azedarach TaxID=155640 RepID=A0ACC1Y8U1_MELAZ|nr:Amidase 1 [Melia azedarach]
MASRHSDYGAFMEKFVLQPSSSPHQLPLSGLTFAVKDIFDVDGHVTGFGNPDWARTHSAAKSTAPAVLAVLSGGATCIGKTVMDEMAYSINGENRHYGTPTNPCAPDRVPGGSSSGSAVAVGATLVDFSLGTDTGGSVRVPASYCGVFGFRPSHNAVSTAGVIPMAQSFDTVGWFARDPTILNQVGRVLLQLPDVHLVRPTQVMISEDCLQLSSIPSDRITQVLVKSVEKLIWWTHCKECDSWGLCEGKSSKFKAFHKPRRQSSRVQHTFLGSTFECHEVATKHRYEFKNNHGEWVTTVKPDLGPGISERVWEAIRTSEENIDLCQSVKTELRNALTALLGDYGILVIPTVPGPPPKLQMDPTALETYRARAFSLLSIAGVSGFCQVSIPLGLHDNLPVAISLLAKHGSDGFLLNLVETLHDTLKQELQSTK